MTDAMIINYIQNQTGFIPELKFTCENFMTINFFNNKTNFIINKNKQRSNGSKIRDFTEDEMLKELKKRCNVIKKYVRQ